MHTLVSCVAADLQGGIVCCCISARWKPSKAQLKEGFRDSSSKVAPLLGGEGFTSESSLAASVSTNSESTLSLLSVSTGPSDLHSSVHSLVLVPDDDESGGSSPRESHLRQRRPRPLSESFVGRWGSTSTISVPGSFELSSEPTRKSKGHRWAKLGTITKSQSVLSLNSQDPLSPLSLDALSISGKRSVGTRFGAMRDENEGSQYGSFKVLPVSRAPSNVSLASLPEVGSHPSLLAFEHIPELSVRLRYHHQSSQHSQAEDRF